MNPTLKLLAGHRSVRKFEPVPLAEETVRACVAAAQQAASSSNVQPYSLLQVHDAKTREVLAECTGGQPQVAEAGAFFAVCAEQRRHRLLGEDQGRPYVPNLETFLVGAIDAALFAQNLVIAFESEGLGTCYIGGLRNELERVRELLELPPDVFPLFGLCVGVPAEDPDLKPRLRLDAVLHHDRCPDEATVRADVAELDVRMAEYYARRGLAGRDWSGGVSRKLARANRSTLRGFYRSQGAELD